MYLLQNCFQIYEWIDLDKMLFSQFWRQFYFQCHKWLHGVMNMLFYIRFTAEFRIFIWSYNFVASDMLCDFHRKDCYSYLGTDCHRQLYMPLDSKVCCEQLCKCRQKSYLLKKILTCIYNINKCRKKDN